MRGEASRQRVSVPTLRVVACGQEREERGAMATGNINVEIKADMRPPLGLRPRNVVMALRFQEVCEAIKRYWDAGYKLPIEWIEEYNELLEKMHGDGVFADKTRVE